MNTKLNEQIQNLFEFEVARDPVQSTMTQAVVQKMTNIWQGNLKQYTMTSEQQLRSKVKDFKKLTANMGKINIGVKKCVGTDPIINKKAAPVDAVATVDLIAKEMPRPDINIIKRLYGALTYESFLINEKPTKNPEEKLNELIQTITLKAREWGLTKEQVYGILAMAYDGELNTASWNSWLNNLSKAETTADMGMSKNTGKVT